ISILLILIALPCSAQIERWVFVYNGPGNGYDVANSLVYGADGNIYVAGYSWGSEGNSDIIVISLNKDTGDTNWVFRYNGPGNGADAANSLVYGADGNIYAAGYCTGSGTGRDFIVIGLNKNTGDTNWVYQYNGPGNLGDGASSVVYGADGNIYAAGGSRGVNTLTDFITVSLTSTGGERWVYRYNGPADSLDGATSLVYGADGNIYAAGYSDWTIGDLYQDFPLVGLKSPCGEEWDYGHNWPDNGMDMVYSGVSGVGSRFRSRDVIDFTVISVTAGGAERWVYTDAKGVANDIVYGSDGNVYAAGYFNDNGYYWDIGVVSLTSSGSARWTYGYSGPPGSSGDDWDEAYAIVYGLDSNIYVAGVSDSTDAITPTPDFTVISLTPGGGERWVYRYDGEGGESYDYAHSCCYAADSHIYAAGTSYWREKFTVIDLASTGSESWIYTWDDVPGEERALSVTDGADGNIYAAGYTGGDLIAISLNPAGAVAEHQSQTIDKNFTILTGTFQKRNLTFTLTLSEANNISLSLYSISGQKVQSWQVSAPKGSSQYKMDLGSLGVGVYILRAETERKGYCESRKVIFIK
ncbi:T9SS type A sorting domain-containing protein, partial [candidate division WOR-3 bacterium]|nr:T9SS type A sorting domain-containing protein [candidate division WOR-3 bacterium]